MNKIIIPNDIKKMIMNYKSNMEYGEKLKKLNKEFKKKIKYYNIIINNDDINVAYSVLKIKLSKEIELKKNYKLKEINNIFTYTLNKNKSLLIEKEKEWVLYEKNTKWDIINYGSCHLQVKIYLNNNKMRKIIDLNFKDKINTEWFQESMINNKKNYF